MQSRGPVNNLSGAITAGGTAQDVATKNDARNYLLFQNTSDTDMYLCFGKTATATNGIKLAASSLVPLIFEGAFIPTGKVSVLCATTSKTFVCLEG